MAEKPPRPSNELPGDLGGILDPKPTHPIFLWSWYKLPPPLTGYLVIPSHVPFPGDPIEFPEKPSPSPVPTPQEVEADS